MKINPRYVIYHDLIGFNVSIRNKSNSYDSQFIDIGTVIDESKNMLITEKNNQIKKYIKKDHMFRISIDTDEEKYKLEVNGQKIVGRPENRLRRLRKKKRFKK